MSRSAAQAHHRTGRAKGHAYSATKELQEFSEATISQAFTATAGREAARTRVQLCLSFFHFFQCLPRHPGRYPKLAEPHTVSSGVGTALAAPRFFDGLVPKGRSLSTLSSRNRSRNQVRTLKNCSAPFSFFDDSRSPDAGSVEVKMAHILCSKFRAEQYWTCPRLPLPIRKSQAVVFTIYDSRPETGCC